MTGKDSANAATPIATPAKSPNVDRARPISGTFVPASPYECVPIVTNASPT
jgi:hypothetical protein